MANRYLLKHKELIGKLAMPVTFILIGVVARIIPHLPNFAPIGAMALFGGANLTKKQALTLPLLAMIFSDFVIGFDSLPMRFAVYGCFLVSVFIGFWIKNHKNYKNIVMASLASSFIFFIVTNVAVWFFGSMYAKTPTGLIECFTLAIPFFRNTILGDLFYIGVFFGGYELALKNLSRFSVAKS